MASLPVNDFTEGALKSNKIIIMGPGGAGSVKSRKYNPMVVLSSPDANILYDMIR